MHGFNYSNAIFLSERNIGVLSATWLVRLFDEISFNNRKNFRDISKKFM